MTKIVADNELSLTFCATGRTGLGHLRRITNIAKKVAHLAPAARLALYTNAQVAGLEHDEISLFNSINVVPRDRMADRLASAGSGPIIVDTARLPGIEALPNPLCLILRETVEHKLATFRLSGGRYWDAVFIPNPPSHWQPDPTEIGTHRTEAVGWIFRKPDMQRTWFSLPASKSTRRILIASGGGGTGETANYLRNEIDRILECLRERNVLPIHVAQVIGPRASSDSRLTQTDEVIDPGPKLHEAFADQDLIISTVGYNSILELASIDTPVLLVPIQRTYDDQFERAKQWERKLGRLHRAGDAAQSVDWIVATLVGGSRRLPVDLGPSGAEACARSLLEIADRSSIRRSGNIAKKSYSRDGTVDGNDAALRSQKVFLACGRTPPGEFDACSGIVSFPWIDGQTARERLREIGIARSRQSLLDRADIFHRAIDALIDLHGVPASTLQLPQLNPWRLVHPRLAPANPRATGLTCKQCDEARRLVHLADLILQENRNATPNASSVIVHGDFHCGQLIFDANHDFTWLLDLDDLAIGHCEFDLSNFAAHFVTSADLYEGAIDTGFQIIVDLIGRHYDGHVGKTIDQALIATYGAAALLRRMLKLAEQQRLAPSGNKILEAAESLLHLAKAKATSSRRFLREDQTTWPRSTGENCGWEMGRQIAVDQSTETLTVPIVRRREQERIGVRNDAEQQINLEIFCGRAE